MTHLYLDNFRGFSQTLIPFSDVNFLVGENSTGKSSILALLNLLATPEFWFSEDFNQSEHEFGGYRDILSAMSPPGAEFSFGLFAEKNNPAQSEVSNFTFLASYAERDALPSLSFFGRVLETQLLAIRRFKRLWKYKTIELPKDIDLSCPTKIFNILQTERQIDEASYQNIPKSIPTRANIFARFSLLDQVVLAAKDKKREFFFPFPILGNNFAWLAPIRTKPKRTYDGYGSPYSPAGEHTPFLLRKQLLADTERSESFRAALEAFGKASGLFKSVGIHQLGTDAAAPFEVLVQLLPRCPLRINSVGYGVSQVLPLIVEILARTKRSWYSIQQPEVHLHPKAQAALGDVIFQMAELEGKRFFIETHSDFTIDRFRMNFKKTSPHKTTAQILFFERSQAGNTVHILPLKDNGEYPETQPNSFRDFFLREQLALLEF